MKNKRKEEQTSFLCNPNSFAGWIFTLAFSLPARMNDEFNMHKRKGDWEYFMLMAGIHVQMTAVRYRDDINIASLFPAPTPLTHPPLAVHRLQFIKWTSTLWRKALNLLGCEGVSGAFSFDIIVQLWFNLAKQLWKLSFFAHTVQWLPRDAICPEQAISRDLRAVVCLVPAADVTLDIGTVYKEQSHCCTFC